LEVEVVIVDNIISGANVSKAWEHAGQEILKLPNISTVKMIPGKYTPDKYNFHRFTMHREHLKNLTSYFAQRWETGIASDSKFLFIFPNARDALAIQIKEFCEFHSIDATFIGFWLDSMYHQSGDVRTKLRGRKYKWSERFERALFYCYDYNLVPLQSFDRMLKTYSTKHADSIIKCPIPYTSIISELSNTYGSETKEDIVLINGTPSSNFDQKLAKVFSNQFPKYTFVNIHDHSLDSASYLKLLSRAKVIFSTNISDQNPFSIYEAMVLGALPILPDIPLYAEIFDERWLYDHKILKGKYLNFVRGSEELEERLVSYMENYENLNRDSELERIHDKYFKSDKFLEIVCKIQ